MGQKNVDDLRGVVFCCHGGSCTRAGARTVEKALRLHARESQPRGSVRFVRTACTGLCKSAPIVIVCTNASAQADGTQPSTCGAHWQLEVQPEDAPPLLDSHFTPQDLAKPGSAQPLRAEKAKSKGKKKQGKKK